MTRDKSGLYVEKVSLTVTNACRDSTGASYVLLIFKENERGNAKSIFYTGSTVRSLKGGESFTQTFEVSDKRIVFGRYVRAEADPYKKTDEAKEDNNWRTLFPNDAGTLPSEAQCAG